MVWKRKPIGDAEDLEALGDEVEAGRRPVALVRSRRHGGDGMRLNGITRPARASTTAKMTRASTRMSSGAALLT